MFGSSIKLPYKINKFIFHKTKKIHTNKNGSTSFLVKRKFDNHDLAEAKAPNAGKKPIIVYSRSFLAS